MSRAKRVIKKKVPIIRIILLITLVGGIIAGILNYNPHIRQEIASLISGKVESYDINDCVKAAYTEGDNRYIPIYYNNYKEQITREDIISKFASRGVEVESISSTTIGTGTVIKTKSTVFGTTYNSTYTVIIYGDVNGDGKVNVLDINKIVEYYLNKGAGSSNLTGAYAKAANVEEISKNQINVLDINRIVGFMFYENAVVEVLPYADSNPSIDKIPPTIELNGDSTVRVIIGEKYNELGVTVKDNLDPHVRVTAEPDPNGVDTSYEHTVNITYTAEDAAGNKSSVTRTVKIEPKSEVIMALDHPEKEYIAISLGEDYDASLLGAHAENERDGASLNVTSSWDKEFNKEIPGIYTITYTASNEQETKSITQKIEVIDPIIDMTINIPANKIYNGEDIFEDSEINLNGITVTLIKEYSGATSAMPISKLKEEYNNQFKIKVTPFTGTKVEYDDNNPGVKDLKLSITWTNPVTGVESRSYEKSLGTANVIGKIREILLEGSQEQTGDIYTEIEVAKFNTPVSQENFTDGSLKARITPAGSENTRGYRIIVDQNGIATLYFWGANERTYTIELYTESDKVEGGEVKYTLNPITLKKGTTPNNIELTRTNDKEFLKDSGEAGNYRFAFTRIYKKPGTDEVIINDPIDVTGKVSFKYTGNAIDTSDYLTATISQTSDPSAPYVVLTPKTSNITSDVTEVVKVYVEGMEEPYNLNIKVSPKSEYTLKFDITNSGPRAEGAETGAGAFSGPSKNVTLYYKAPDILGNGEGAVRNVDGKLYTLYGVKFIDQYGDEGKDITSGMLDAGGIDGVQIGFNDNGANVIKAIGFKEDNTKAEFGETVRYIGIAIEGITGKEDEMLKTSGNEVKVLQNQEQVALLKVINIEKKDIVSLVFTTDDNLKKTIDYRYSIDEKTKDRRPSIVAQVKSGIGEKDLKASDLNYEVTYKGAGTENTTGRVITGELSNVGLGRINVRFRATELGTYTIKVSLKTNPSAFASWDILIKEDPRINKVMFRADKDDTAKDSFGKISNEVALSREIVYLHEYKNIPGIGNVTKPIEDTDKPARNTVTITPNTSGLQITPMQGKYVIPDGAVDKLTDLNIGYTGGYVGITGTFNMRIEQNILGYGEHVANIENIGVSIVSEIKITKVGMSSVNDESPAKLYYGTHNDLPGTWNDNSKTYTIFNIWYEDENSVKHPIKASDISYTLSTSNVLITTDNALIVGPRHKSDIQVVPLEATAEDEYRVSGTGTFVNYVGITLMPAGIGAPTSIKLYLEKKLMTQPISVEAGDTPSSYTVARDEVTTFNVGDSVEEPVTKATVDGMKEDELPNISTPEQVIKPENNNSNGSAEIVTKPQENEGTVTEESSKPAGEEPKQEDGLKPVDSTTEPNGTVSDKPKDPEDKTVQDSPESDLPID